MSQLRIDASVFTDPDAPVSTYEGRCSPDRVIATVGDVGQRVAIYITPAQARAWAAALMRDAVRCDTHNADRALAAQAEAA